MESSIFDPSYTRLQAGKTEILIAEDEVAMGLEAQKLVSNLTFSAAEQEKKIVFWLMAAPSGFSWYNAFVEYCKTNKTFSDVVKKADFFQFDDYRIARNDPRFPVTFRHLLEDRFFHRLGDGYPGEERIHLLELTGADSDSKVIRNYYNLLQTHLNDPSTYVIQIKGIGMDGHWGFHGRETPIDHPAEFMEVPINRQNRIQQTIDWPEYFPDLKSVPDTAITASVQLFLQADTIVDLVPQRSKLFALLAAYGTEDLVPEIPSSALKQHPDAYSFVTHTAAEALLAYRQNKSLTPDVLAALDSIWNTDEESRKWSHQILNKLGILMDQDVKLPKR